MTIATVSAPFEVFTFTVLLCIIIPVFAFYMRTKIFSSAVFFVCGGILLILALILTHIDMGQTPVSSTESGSTTTYVFEQNLYPLKNEETGEPNIIDITFILFAIMIVMIGVLIEKYA